MFQSIRGAQTLESVFKMKATLATYLMSHSNYLKGAYCYNMVTILMKLLHQSHTIEKWPMGNV